MAESSSEKTEMPTQKKLRDARNKGQVCTSKDIVSTAALVVLFCLCGMMGKGFIQDYSSLLDFVALRTAEDPIKTVMPGVNYFIFVTFKYSFIFAVVAALMGIVANVAQIGFLFTLEPLKPNLSKLNPAEGFKKIFSKKNLFELLKNILKVGFLSYLIWKLLKGAIPELLTLGYGTIEEMNLCIVKLLKKLAVYTGFGYIVIAIVDRLFQGKNFIKEMMMTKDEVKREYKEMEGSQEVKQAQREFRNELLNGPPPETATKNANVVVTNPTHLAIGIRYDIEEAPIPRVVVAGADNLAKIIRETAQREGIPIMENVPLARALWAKCKVDDYIPVELAEPVAEVLKWVKELEASRKEEEELDAIELD